MEGWEHADSHLLVHALQDRRKPRLHHGVHVCVQLAKPQKAHEVAQPRGLDAAEVRAGIDLDIDPVVQGRRTRCRRLRRRRRIRAPPPVEYAEAFLATRTKRGE